MTTMTEDLMICNAYKLTTQDGKTRKEYANETRWGEMVTHTASGEGGLCGPGWLHYYAHPLLAVLLNPIHACIYDPALWEAHAAGHITTDRGLKAGCTSLTTLRRIAFPAVTTEQRVKFGILCAMQVYSNQAWIKWANNWLAGKDRAASYATDRAAHAADATDAAAYAAYATDAAAYAAYAARAANAADAIDADADAEAAAHAAAAHAAAAAAYAADAPINLIALAEEALRGWRIE
jgi:hypothetical protein